MHVWVQVGQVAAVGELMVRVRIGCHSYVAQDRTKRKNVQIV